MSVLSLALLGGFTGLAVLAAKRRGSRPWAAAALFVGAIVALELVVFGLGPIQSGPIEVLGALAAAIAAAEAFGLPRPLARRLRIGLRSREWEFDGRLKRLVDGFDDLIREYPGPEDQDRAWRWANRVLERGARIVSKIRTLRAPNAAWQELATGYADMFDSALESMRDGGGISRREAIERVRTDLERRREELRQAYRDEARVIMSGRR